MAIRTVRYSHEQEVSDDPDVQQAIEQIVIDTLVTYRLVATCWIWIRDVRIVRLLCKQRGLAISEYVIIREAMKISDLLKA